MDAAASIELNLVTRTPFLDRLDAPKAEARVNVAGIAMGTEAINKINAKGRISLIGNPDISA